MTSSRAGSTGRGGRVATLHLVQAEMPGLPPLRTRWAMTTGISVTELVSWGTLVYAFSAFVVPMRADLGWSPAVFTSTYTAASLLSGLVAVPVGRVLARRSPHAVMLAGAVLACVALAAWSQVTAVWSFVATVLLVGVAMAMTLYEPAFVLTARWFDEHARPRAVAVVTMVAGLAATVFVPLSGALSGALGWRPALLVLAGVVAVLAVPIHLVLLRTDRPSTPTPTPTVRAGGSTEPRARARGGRSLPWIVLSLAASSALKYGVVVLLVAFLVASGQSLHRATLGAGLVGVLQVLGRLFTTAAASRWPEQRVTVVLFAVQAVSLGALPAVAGPGPTASTATALAIAGFGLGSGQAELLRGTLLVTLYGTEDYPRINGLVSGFVVAARGAGPFAFGLLVTVTSSYTPALLVAATLALIAAAALPVGLCRHRRDDRLERQEALP